MQKRKKKKKKKENVGVSLPREVGKRQAPVAFEFQLLLVLASKLCPYHLGSR